MGRGGPGSAKRAQKTSAYCPSLDSELVRVRARVRPSSPEMLELREAVRDRESRVSMADGTAGARRVAGSVGRERAGGGRREGTRGSGKETKGEIGGGGREDTGRETERVETRGHDGRRIRTSGGNAGGAHAGTRVRERACSVVHRGARQAQAASCSLQAGRGGGRPPSGRAAGRLCSRLHRLRTASRTTVASTETPLPGRG
ncbi:unnamed protein product [Lampetra fluviatilis]